MLLRHMVTACVLSLLCTSHQTINPMEMEQSEEPSRCRIIMTVLGSMCTGGAGYLAYAMMKDKPALGTFFTIISVASGAFTVCCNCDRICRHNNFQSCRDIIAHIFKRNTYQKLLIRNSANVYTNA